jgi:hypothetical protein
MMTLGSRIDHRKAHPVTVIADSPSAALLAVPVAVPFRTMVPGDGRSVEKIGSPRVQIGFTLAPTPMRSTCVIPWSLHPEPAAGILVRASEPRR